MPTNRNARILSADKSPSRGYTFDDGRFDPSQHVVYIQLDSEPRNRLERGTYHYAWNGDRYILSVDPQTDILDRVAQPGTYRLTYDVARTLATNLLVQAISGDRTEMRLYVSQQQTDILDALTIMLGGSVFSFVYGYTDIATPPIINHYYVPTDEALYVKFDGPIPVSIRSGDSLDLFEEVLDPYTVELEVEELEQITSPVYLRPDLSYVQPVVSASESPKTLHQLPTGSVQTNQLITPLDVDFTDFSQFVTLSSARMRIENFFNKVGKIQQLSAQLTSLSGYNAQHIQEKIDRYIRYFDPFESYLYFSFEPHAYPKIAGNPVSTTSSAALAWLGNDTSGWISSGSLYDASNVNRIGNYVPTYLQENAGNESYLTFVEVLAHYFDVLQLYDQRFSVLNEPGVRRKRQLDPTTVRRRLVAYAVAIGDGLTTSIADRNTLLDDGLTTSATLRNSDWYADVYPRLIEALPLLRRTRGSAEHFRLWGRIFGIPDGHIQPRPDGETDRIDRLRYAYQLTGSAALTVPLSAMNTQEGAVYFRFRGDLTPSQSLFSAQLAPSVTLSVYTQPNDANLLRYTYVTGSTTYASYITTASPDWSNALLYYSGSLMALDIHRYGENQPLLTRTYLPGIFNPTGSYLRFAPATGSMWVQDVRLMNTTGSSVTDRLDAISGSLLTEYVQPEYTGWSVLGSYPLGGDRLASGSITPLTASGGGYVVSRETDYTYVHPYVTGSSPTTSLHPLLEPSSPDYSPVGRLEFGFSSAYRDELFLDGIQNPITGSMFADYSYLTADSYPFYSLVKTLEDRLPTSTRFFSVLDGYRNHVFEQVRSSVSARTLVLAGHIVRNHRLRRNKHAYRTPEVLFPVHPVTNITSRSSVAIPVWKTPPTQYVPLRINTHQKINLHQHGYVAGNSLGQQLPLLYWEGAYVSTGSQTVRYDTTLQTRLQPVRDAIQRQVNYIGYFTDAVSDSMLADRTLLNLKYLIDDKGSCIELNERNRNHYTVQNLFRNGDSCVISQFNPNRFTSQRLLNGVKRVHESGVQYRLMFYASASENYLQFDITDTSVDRNLYFNYTEPRTRNITQNTTIYNLFPNRIYDDRNHYMVGDASIGLYSNYTIPTTGQYTFMVNLGLRIQLKGYSDEADYTLGVYLNNPNQESMLLASQNINFKTATGSVKNPLPREGFDENFNLKFSSYWSGQTPLLPSKTIPFNSTSIWKYSDQGTDTTGSYLVYVDQYNRSTPRFYNESGKWVDYGNPYIDRAVELKIPAITNTVINSGQTFIAGDRVFFTLRKNRLTNPIVNQVDIISGNVDVNVYGNALLSTGSLIREINPDNVVFDRAFTVFNEKSDYIYLPQSSSLYSKYGEITEKFNIKPGDRLNLVSTRLSQIESQLIQRVEKTKEGYLRVVLAGELSATLTPDDIQEYLLFKRRNDETSLLVNHKKREGKTGGGFVIPADLRTDFADNYDTILKEVKQKLIDEQNTIQ